MTSLNVVSFAFMEDKNSHYISDNADLTLTIDNRLKYAYLSSPVLFVDNENIINGLAPELAPKAYM
jgi:hypothetical protein